MDYGIDKRANQGMMPETFGNKTRKIFIFIALQNWIYYMYKGLVAQKALQTERHRSDEKSSQDAIKIIAFTLFLVATHLTRQYGFH